MAVESRSDFPKLGLGMIGLGVASMGMLPSFISHPLVRIVAGADLRKDARERFAQEFKARTYEKIEDLCQDSAVDLVYIATPHQFHVEQAITAARMQKHIILEKPLALTIEDCQAVITEVDRAGVKMIVGHTNSFDPPIMKMREVIRSGELGRLRLINTFNYTEFLYRPRRPEELDTTKGGGIIFNQTPHQVDMVRLIGGGMVRSVRAYAGAWDEERPTEAAMTSFLDFEDGVAATILYNGYAHFDAEEFWGKEQSPGSYGALRRSIHELPGMEQEAAMKASIGYGGSRQKGWGDGGPKEHEHFGVTIVSCDRGDIRPLPEGIAIYGDHEVRRLPVPFGRGGGIRATVVDEIYDAAVLGKPLVHDARWAMATLEVCLAILESSRKREEIFLSRQVPTRDW